jgi:transcriptional regulator with XRE-family HTH domain
MPAPQRCGVSIVGVMPLRLTAVTVDAGDLATDRARVETLRRSLGAHLALYRTAAGVSQPELGQMIGRTPSMVSKIEHGRRGMSAELWKITDDVCHADGALVAEHSTLTQVEQDYRDRCRAHRRQEQIRRVGEWARTQALSPCRAPVPPAAYQHEGMAGQEMGPPTVLVSGELAEELMQVVANLVRRVGRRDAMRIAGWGALGLSGLDAEEYTRLALAVAAPRRVDAQVINNLAAVLAHCKRQEDMLGPCQVLETVRAQHRLVRRLLDGGCPEQLRRSLSLIDSNMASTIGGYLVDMGQPADASRYFADARRAAHDARNPAYAAYAAANTSFAAFVRADTPTALDTAAAARSLATRTDDHRLKALVEQTAAAAYALDGQHGPCMIACDRAHDFLVNANGSAPQSPAYYLHHGSIDSTRSLLLSRLGRPSDALDAASTAQAHYDRTQCRYAMCEVRLGHALVLSKEITEAARVLGDAASQAHLFPRLTGELHAVRALMTPWDNTHAVKTLDDQLQACGLTPIEVHTT